MRQSDKGWLVIPLYVAAWDAFCRRGEMLSQASQRYCDAHPILWPVVVIYVAGHLIHKWPVKYDPLSRLATALGRD